MSGSTSVTYVIGHRNPDPDAICSAIAYADLLRRTERPDAVAARCGSVTARTEWVLRTAGAPLPELVMDVRLTVGEVAKRTVVTAAPHETFLDIYQRMIWGGLRSIPVVEGENQLVGLLSLQDLLKLLLPVGESPERIRVVRTALADMVRTLDGVLPVEMKGGKEQEDLIVMVAASSLALVKEKVSQFPNEQLLVITGDREEVHELAVASKVRCLVVTGGFDVSKDTLRAAEERGVAIVCTQHDTASSIQLIRGSRRIEEAVSSDFIQFESGTLVDALQATIRESAQPLFPVIDEESGQLVGVFSRSDLINLPSPKLILVDHNEFSQAVHGAEEASILEVIDHHRLSGNLTSKEPIRFVNLPVGSTCTIVGRLFWDKGLIPPRSIATCMCAGIISDTLKLTSPTTTDEDRKLLEWLSKIAGIDVDAFAEEFFAAGSVLNSMPAAEALGTDRKEYQESGYAISISQIEELGLNHFWPAQEELQQELGRMVHSRGMDVACAMITDIGSHVSILLIEAPDNVLERVDYPRKEHGVYEMDGVVSRKKQLFPWLSRLLSSVPKGA